MRLHHYLDGLGDVIRIKSATRPSDKTKPKSSTWIVQEYNFENSKWEMPCFPEITWSTLRRFEYLGSRELEQGE